MPTNELIQTQLPATLIADITTALNDVVQQLSAFGQNLTKPERIKFGSINEKNKLFVNKVRDFRVQQPNLSSPDVDWVLVEDHWRSRSGFEQIEAICNSILEICSDPRILHDYSLYQNAIIDYDYSKYKANSTQGGAAYTTKVEELKQFFPNPSGNNGGEDEPDPQPVPEPTPQQ